MEKDRGRHQWVSETRCVRKWREKNEIERESLEGDGEKKEKTQEREREEKVYLFFIFIFAEFGCVSEKVW